MFKKLYNKHKEERETKEAYLGFILFILAYLLASATQ